MVDKLLLYMKLVIWKTDLKCMGMRSLKTELFQLGLECWIFGIYSHSSIMNEAHVFPVWLKLELHGTLYFLLDLRLYTLPIIGKTLEHNVNLIFLQRRLGFSFFSTKPNLLKYWQPASVNTVSVGGMLVCSGRILDYCVNIHITE